MEMGEKNYAQLILLHRTSKHNSSNSNNNGVAFEMSQIVKVNIVD